MHLIYVSADDLYESNAKNRFKDRMQLNLASNKIVNGELKAPGIKKVLYNCKVLYYLYLRFPLFVNKKNKETHVQTVKTIKEMDVKSINSILSYCEKNYDQRKIVLVFHPGTPIEIDSLARKHGFGTIGLNTTGDVKSWAVSSSDGHWSCYGHHEVAKQIKKYLANYITSINNSESKTKIALNK
jgi:23S rRNA G2445 N2-methylase RlmL